MRALQRAGVETTGACWFQGQQPLIVNAGRLILHGGVRFFGSQHAAELHIAREAVLEIGANTLINQGCTIAAHRSIRIGADCLIGEHVAIHDTHFHAVSPGAAVLTAPVTIGRNVWVGHRGIILPGVEIGDHAVIGAASVVTSSVAARTVVAGIPARAIRTFQCDDEWKRE